MKFELNEYKRELTDEEILDNIKSVANKLNTNYISISTYKKYGKYSQTAIQGHFATWKNALLASGLRTDRTVAELKQISDEEYFADINRVAKLINSDTVPYEEYKKYGKYSCAHIFHRFGKWNCFLRKAGLKETGFTKDRITKQQCFDEINRIWTLLGRQPTTTDIVNGGVSIYSIDTFKRRFGGWRKAIEEFVDYMNSLDTSDKYDQQVMAMQENKDVTLEIDNSVKVSKKNSITIKSNKTERKTTRNINLRLKYKILKRDHYTCCACGASPAKDPSVVLHVDHIIPWSKGGETVEENLQTLCSKCNLGKSDLL